MSQLGNDSALSAGSYGAPLANYVVDIGVWQTAPQRSDTFDNHLRRAQESKPAEDRSDVGQRGPEDEGRNDADSRAAEATPAPEAPPRERPTPRDGGNEPDAVEPADAAKEPTADEAGERRDGSGENEAASGKADSAERKGDGNQGKSGDGAALRRAAEAAANETDKPAKQSVESAEGKEPAAPSADGASLREAAVDTGKALPSEPANRRADSEAAADEDAKPTVDGELPRAANERGDEGRRKNIAGSRAGQGGSVDGKEMGDVAGVQSQPTPPGEVAEVSVGERPESKSGPRSKRDRKDSQPRGVSRPVEPAVAPEPVRTAPGSTVQIVAAETPIAAGQAAAEGGESGGGENRAIEGPKPVGPTGAEARAETSAARTTLDPRGAAEPGQPDSPAGQVERARFVRRVADAFRAMGDRQGPMRLKLHPPELGSLRLEIQVRSGVLTARAEAETSAARNLILEHLPALRERLAGQDIKIQHFDVDLSDRSSGGMPQHTADQGPFDRQQSDTPHVSGRPGREKQAEEPVEPVETSSTPGDATQLNVLI